ncbi:hypothetical protein UFOVP149_22 [uncultured Caudovirales phage]|uniref:Uncharacterized protein n=1 Tax=uncultured Caudovirales phage TaxID=2100421 RepID=A0A6J7W6J7_9CAUD|nr:hypothetical protein UFOVP149_22 [uncultured Caudovirales phage]
MNWIDAALLVAVLIGVGCGVFMVARSPTFWADVGVAVFAALLPTLKDYIARRNSPEVEAKMHQAARRAQEWDNFNKRPKDK